ncbi:MAG: DUF2283 domain-containing protein [Nanoarchaeota archaeon]
MKIKYDQEADVIYLRFGEGKIVESDEIKDGLIVDYDKNGNPVAIEILNAKEILANNPEISVDFSPMKLEVRK